MLINLLLAFVLFSSPGGAGSSMDPNGIILSDGTLLGDGFVRSSIVVPDPPPIDPPESNVGWHIDPNG